MEWFLVKLKRLKEKILLYKKDAEKFFSIFFYPITKYVTKVERANINPIADS